jgi:hypothetical protein
MQNLDLIIFTTILIILFIIFVIATLAEFSRMNSGKHDEENDKGGVIRLQNFLGKILMGNKK